MSVGVADVIVVEPQLGNRHPEVVRGRYRGDGLLGLSLLGLRLLLPRFGVLLGARLLLGSLFLLGHGFRSPADHRYRNPLDRYRLASTLKRVCAEEQRDTQDDD